MKFNLTFNMDGSAFSDGYREVETGRILEVVTSKIDVGITSSKIMDINGNCVGEWSIEKEEGDDD